MAPTPYTYWPGFEPRGLADEHVDLPLHRERQHVLVRDALAPKDVVG